jgi:CheY-like chemotaxis protein
MDALSTEMDENVDGGIGRHLARAAPRVLVVDGSRLMRRLITRVLETELQGAEVVACADGAEERAALAAGTVDFVTVALQLPDMDGLNLARHIREQIAQTYVPIVVVSGDVDALLRERALGADITDYFDKSRGLHALAAFIRGYVRPVTTAAGKVLYVEDSRVVALSTRRMLEKHGLTVAHVVSAEDAVVALDNARTPGHTGADVVLTDITLKGELSGAELLRYVREDYGYTRDWLPIVVMTADEDRERQAAWIRAGANDLVQKPVEEDLLITKVLFQLRMAQYVREKTRG